MTAACRDFSKLPNTTLSGWGETLKIKKLSKQKKLELPQTAVSTENAKVVGKKSTGSKQIHYTKTTKNMHVYKMRRKKMEQKIERN